MVRTGWLAERYLAFGERVLTVVVVVALTVLLAVNAANISYRTFFGGSFYWAQDVSILCAVTVYFLSYGIVVRRGLEIKVMYLPEKMPAGVARLVAIVGDVVQMAAYLAIGVFGILYARRIAGHEMPITRMPELLLYLPLVIGMFDCVIALCGPAAPDRLSVGMASFWMIIAFAATTLLGFSMCGAMGVSAILGLYLLGIPLPTFARIMIEEVRGVPLLAVPFFILAAQIMNEMRITDRIFNFANHLVGRLPGGLAQVNVASSVFFAGISGSALADIGGLGAMLVRAMERHGYRSEFAAALSVVSSVIAPLVPPSIMFVIFAVNMNVSIGRLFLAGVFPGLLIAAVLMATIFVMAKTGRENCPLTERAPLSRILLDLATGLPAIVSPAIIVGGLVFGLVTPTEASVVAVLYSIAVGIVFGECKIDRLVRALRETCLSTSVIMVLTALGAVMAYVVTAERSADTIARSILGVSDHPLFVLVAINLILLLMGMFIETVPAMLIAIPLLGPVALAAGVDPVHFGVILVFNLLIGIVTPPVGIGVFTISAVTGIRPEAIIRATLPFYVSLFVALVLLTLVPAISLWLPRAVMG